MAACDQLKYSTDESEHIGHVCCSLCLEDGSRTVARHYCVDCEIYYCGRCVKCHNKIPSTKFHHVNDIDLSDSVNVDGQVKGRGNTTTETLRCSIHDGKMIDTHCKDHGEVCCGTCAMVKHRLCSTESIDVAAKDFKSSPEVIKNTEALRKVLTQLKEVKENRTENIDCIDQQKLELMEAVDQYGERIIKKVKELANISRQEIRAKYEEHKTSLDIDVQAIDAAVITATTYLDKLEHIENEPELFVASKTTGKIIAADGEYLLEAMTKESNNRALIYTFDKTLENTLDGLDSFGRLEDICPVKEYKATLQKTLNIKQDKESNTALCDMCLMDSGDLILIHFHNKKLKRFNSEMKYKDCLVLSGISLAVCKIGTHEVAVRYNGSQLVQFISVGPSMQATSSFNIANGNFGMTYDSSTGEIYAGEGNKISVYSKTGNKLRTYDKDTNGEAMFSACTQIALSEVTKDIYVADNNTGLVVLDKSGHLKMKVSLSGINGAWPLCMIPGQICLVGSQHSGVIVQIDKDGKQIGTLIDTKDGRDYTYCAVYDQHHSRLLVGGSQGLISIYTVSPK